MVQGLPLSPQPPALPGWWFHLHFGEGKSIFHKEESLTQTLPWLPPRRGSQEGPASREAVSLSRRGPGCGTRRTRPRRCATEPGDAFSARAAGDRVGEEAAWGQEKMGVKESG